MLFTVVQKGQQGMQGWRMAGGKRGREPKGAVEERHTHVYAGDTQ